MSLRSSGILLHISSLPGHYGIGALGDEARKFVDFLVKAGQRYWQILPLGPTSYGDSPYQSFSVFAGNPYFIDLDLLVEDGLLLPSELSEEGWCRDEKEVDYLTLYIRRFNILERAFRRGRESCAADLAQFLDVHGKWAEDYALFMALKEHFQMAAWTEWPDEGIRLRNPERLQYYRRQLSDRVAFHLFVQMLFFRQWHSLKRYANEHGVELIGDMPIYVSLDSADAWSNPELLQLDEQNRPIEVAGCPPDAFSATGQLWGNPLYRWDVLKDDGYGWWIERIRHMLSLVDRLRIDHFRGFESYYAIPAGDPDATGGRWVKGPDIDLFRAIQEQLGSANLIAEDLGYLTPEVYRLLEAVGYPGMKVLQFAFAADGSSSHLPFRYTQNTVAYTGTHDNDTLAGWFHKLSDAERQFCSDYLGGQPHKDAPVWELIALVWGSVADTAVVPMQDLLLLDSQARMNTPATTGENWRWRAPENCFEPALAARLRRLTQVCGRLNW